MIHTVRQGEDIDSIAYQYGFHPDTLWQHADNEPLRKKRRNPNVLYAGDPVVIPEVSVRKEKVQTGGRHTFYRKGVPSSLRIRFGTDKKPRANMPYILKVKTASGDVVPDVSGQTDGSGFLNEAIIPNTTGGEIYLNPGKDEEEYFPFDLGCIDPASDSIEGLQAMLKNMNYYFGRIDGKLGRETIAAIREFQMQEMGRSGDELLPWDATEVDAETIAAIEKAYSE